MNEIEIATQLHAVGIKNTPKKALILKVIIDSQRPLTANKLHLECSKQLKLDLVTVYRTLGQFKQKGIVLEILGSHSSVYYEYSGSSSHAHPHFQCEKCQELICLSPLSFNDALYFSKMASQHKINTVNISLSGLCENCL